MLLLPYPARRHWLVAFWLVASFAGGLSIAALLGLTYSPEWLASAALLIPAIMLPGLLRPQIALLPYRIYNRLARYHARVLHPLLMGICFYAVFLPAKYGKLGGSRLALNRAKPGESMWIPRNTLSPANYFGPLHAVLPARRGAGWVSNFISWSVGSGNVWAFSLLPFIILLRLLETRPEKSGLPNNLYTLF